MKLRYLSFGRAYYIFSLFCGDLLAQLILPIMNRNKFLFLILFLIYSLKITAQPDVVNRPKLVVGIVYDQMRWDYLYRYYDRLSEGGFKRLLNEGFNCQNTMINYLPTFTAPGHSCIYTGTVPALHGIAANDWMDVASGKEIYCCEDNSVKPLGGGNAGLMSPRNLLTTTIADELRMATNFTSKSIGISLKDRGAIIPAGHQANGAFWYDSESGNFISSNYYFEQLPFWVQQFNARNLADSFLNLGWETLYAINTYTQSTTDDNAFEGTLKGETKPTFPHNTFKKSSKGVLRQIPAGITFTRLMAQAAIEGENLGANKTTDFLAVSFSTTDYIGHMFGPNSIEVEDAYLRADQDLELFLQYLDKKIGKENYLVFLTADHGGAHNPTFLASHNTPAGFIWDKEVKKTIKEKLSQKYGDTAAFMELTNYQIYLNEKIIKDKKWDRDDIKSTIINVLKDVPGIGFVMDMEHPNDLAIPTKIKEMAINGYNPKRSGIIQIITNAAWFSAYYKTGTTHGTWNPYDAHIPLLWYGWGIKKGQTFRNINMTDIAPTLAALLKIQMPNGCIGEPILEIVNP